MIFDIREEESRQSLLERREEDFPEAFMDEHDVDSGQHKVHNEHQLPIEVPETAHQISKGSLFFPFIFLGFSFFFVLPLILFVLIFMFDFDVRSIYVCMIFIIIILYRAIVGWSLPCWITVVHFFSGSIFLFSFVHFWYSYWVL